MRLHIHNDPDWQQVGCWRLHECHRCGARRIAAAYANLSGPAPDGWATLLCDSHGVALRDSGWVPSPAGGWLFGAVAAASDAGA